MVCKSCLVALPDKCPLQRDHYREPDRVALEALCRVTVHGTVSDHQSLIDWSLADPGPELVFQLTLSFLLSDDSDPHCHFLTDLSLMAADAAAAFCVFPSDNYCPSRTAC